MVGEVEETERAVVVKQALLFALRKNGGPSCRGYLKRSSLHFAPALVTFQNVNLLDAYAADVGNGNYMMLNGPILNDNYHENELVGVGTSAKPFWKEYFASWVLEMLQPCYRQTLGLIELQLISLYICADGTYGFNISNLPILLLLFQNPTWLEQ